MTHRQKILDYFEQGYAITKEGALGLTGCKDLSTVVRDLKMVGHNIQKRFEKTIQGRRAVYFLEVN